MQLFLVFLNAFLFGLVVECSPVKQTREVIHIDPPPPTPPPLIYSARDSLVSPTEDDYFEEPSDYHFNYLVDDVYTGNYQTREETKDGHRVTGSYTLLEPTGALRIVTYVADQYGFRAMVRRKWPMSDHHIL